MKLTLTNFGPIAVPLIAGDQVDPLEPGTAFNYDGGESVAVIGDKPSVRTQFQQAYDVLSATAKALLEAFQTRTAPNMPTDDTATVNITIQNNGANAVRVILGDGVTDFNLAPGAIQDATAKGYLELRELGLVNPTIETQPSSAA